MDYRRSRKKTSIHKSELKCYRVATSPHTSVWLREGFKSQQRAKEVNCEQDTTICAKLRPAWLGCHQEILKLHHNPWLPWADDSKLAGQSNLSYHASEGNTA